MTECLLRTARMQQGKAELRTGRSQSHHTDWMMSSTLVQLEGNWPSLFRKRASMAELGVLRGQ